MNPEIPVIPVNQRHSNPASPVPVRGSPRFFKALLLLSVAAFSLSYAAGERELVRDPHFQSGFYLLEPKPGKRVVYGESAGLAPGKPVWDLAQWSSKCPLQLGNCVVSAKSIASPTAPRPSSWESLAAPWRTSRWPSTPAPNTRGHASRPTSLGSISWSSRTLKILRRSPNSAPAISTSKHGSNARRWSTPTITRRRSTPPSTSLPHGGQSQPQSRRLWGMLLVRHSHLR